MRALLVAWLAGLLLVPAASARGSHGVQLALVPLPRSAIGPVVARFSLAHDSGPVSNSDAASHTADATARTFRKLGRVNGYALEYGNAFTGGAGVTGVRTSVEQYRSFADARRALGFWRKEDARLGKLDNPDFSVTSVPVRVPPPAAGTSHFAYLTSYSAANIAPVGKVSVSKRYVVDPAAISDYSVVMLPAGQFYALDQEIEWYPAANEASFFADFENAAAPSAAGTTPPDLGALDDNAQGSVTGPSVNGGQVFLSSGRLAEFIFMAGRGPISSTAVTRVARAAAARVDAAGPGT